jgi:8-oxo-dGTP diphosphatase
VKITQVAAAVLVRPDGSFLLGQRGADTFYPGYWEFPGGKVEPGESPAQALARELSEELGIRVVQAYPWLTREHHYEHAHVRLHFFRVVAWQGELQHHVHSALTWQSAAEPSVTPMLPANAPILRALTLPALYAITHAATIGIEAQLEALRRALSSGLKLIQIREPGLAPDVRREFARAVVSLGHAAGARVLVNGDEALSREVGADGVHLPTRSLLSLDARPDFPWVAASCHSSAELAAATSLGVDFVVVGPVRETASHPGQPVLGWNRFAEMVAGVSLPVYALGGMSAGDLDQAWQAGAHGIAAIRGAWVG